MTSFEEWWAAEQADKSFPDRTWLETIRAAYHAGTEQAEKELAEAREETQSTNADADEWDRHVADLNSELDELRQQLSRYREAMEFIADTDRFDLDIVRKHVKDVLNGNI